MRRRLRTRRRGLVWLLVLSLLSICRTSPVARAGEDVGLTVRDPVNASAVWAGRVIVEREILIGAEATLTISPGTEVLFDEGAGLLVSGALVAEGTAEKPIRLGAAGPDAAPGAWAGITLVGRDDCSQDHPLHRHARQRHRDRRREAPHRAL